MKRFLLFTNMSYYPDGGWRDFNSDFDTLEEALEGWKKAQTERSFKWDRGHIVDTQEKEIVENLPLD